MQELLNFPSADGQTDGQIACAFPRVTQPVSGGTWKAIVELREPGVVLNDK